MTDIFERLDVAREARERAAARYFVAYGALQVASANLNDALLRLLELSDLLGDVMDAAVAAAVEAESSARLVLDGLGRVVEIEPLAREWYEHALAEVEAEEKIAMLAGPGKEGCP